MIHRSAALAVLLLAAITIGPTAAEARTAEPGAAIEPSAWSGPGPIRVLSSDRSTRGSADLSDEIGKPLSASQVIHAPDDGPFFAEASAGVGRDGSSAAGVTRHISSLSGRVLDLDAHCDANASSGDPDTSVSASCGNHYVIAFEVVRPAKVSLTGEISSSRTGSGGGYGEISLYDEAGTRVVGIEGDFGEMYERLNLAPGHYKLVATGGGSAYVFPFVPVEFSAVTFDQRVTLRVRNY